MAKKSESKKVPFSSVPEGTNPEIFKDVCLLDGFFMDQASTIDFYKLYWAVRSWAEEGNEAVNWIGKARTFVLGSPKQFTPQQKTQNGAELNAATVKFQHASGVADQIIANRGADSFIPEHLRNNKDGN
jgi:hypothetical protein